MNKEDRTNFLNLFHGILIRIQEIGEARNYNYLTKLATSLNCKVSIDDVIATLDTLLQTESDSSVLTFAENVCRTLRVDTTSRTRGDDALELIREGKRACDDLGYVEEYLAHEGFDGEVIPIVQELVASVQVLKQVRELLGMVADDTRDITDVVQTLVGDSNMLSFILGRVQTADAECITDAIARVADADDELTCVAEVLGVDPMDVCSRVEELQAENQRLRRAADAAYEILRAAGGVLKKAVT